MQKQKEQPISPGSGTGVTISLSLPDPVRLESLKAELGVRVEEYRAARAEIVATLISSHSTTTITLTSSGLFLGASPFIIQYHAVDLFLLGSCAFCLIAWSQLNFVHVVYKLSEHIIRVVAPQIRRIINEIGGNRSGATMLDLLSWEESGRDSELWTAPLHAARYIIPIFAAAACGAGFVVNSLQQATLGFRRLTALGGGALVLVLLLYTVFLTNKVRLLTKKYRGDAGHWESASERSLGA